MPHEPTDTEVDAFNAYAGVKEPKLSRVAPEVRREEARGVLREMSGAGTGSGPTGVEFLAGMGGALLDGDDWWTDPQPQLRVFRMNEPEMVTASFRILSGAWPELSRKLDKLAKRAEKYGIKPFKVTVEPSEPIFKPSDVLRAYPYEALLVTVTESPDGSIPGGWEFLAVIQHGTDDEGKPANVLVRNPLSPYKVPVELRNEVSYCSHCNTRRRRNQTYLLVKDGAPGEPVEIKRVGSTCVKEFLQGQTAALLVGYFDYLYAFQAEIQHASRAPDEDYAIHGRPFHYMDAYLASVTACIKAKGWKSRKDYGDESTANDALENLNAYNAQRPHIEMTDDDWRFAGAAVEWAKALPPDVESEYLSNLRSAVYQGDVNRHKGLLASLIMVYQRELDREAAPTNEAPSTHWLKPGDTFNGKFGVLNKKGELKDPKVKGPRLEAVIRDLRVVQSQMYGPSLLFTFSATGPDDRHHVIKWFTTGSETTYKVGDHIWLGGKVKKHDTFKGAKETMISHATMEKING